VRRGHLNAIFLVEEKQQLGQMGSAVVIDGAENHIALLAQMAPDLVSESVRCAICGVDGHVGNLGIGGNHPKIGGSPEERYEAVSPPNRP
jgi:hypothetical protein